MTSRHWCITVNNEPKQIYNVLKQSSLPDKIRYIVAKLERVSRLHLQAYIEYTEPVRNSTVKLIFGKQAHTSIRKGTRDQARNYVLKEETSYKPKKYPPIELGTWIKGQGTRSDLNSMYQLIKEGKTNYELLENNPSTYIKYHKGFSHARSLHQSTLKRKPPKVYIIVGPPGCGKTRYVYDKYPQDQIYSLMESSSTVWFDGYEGQKILLIDDYYGWITYSYLLKLTDRYPLRVQIKGGSTPFLAEKIYITSNKSPRHWYPGQDLSALGRRVRYFRHRNK